MARDEQTLFLAVLGGLVAWEYARPSLERANAALQQGGAQLYELVHPSERDHADDLPGRQMTRAALTELAKRTGFPDVATAVAIALAESGGVTNGRVRSSVENSVGLWQINIKAHPYSAERMADPKENARAAYLISNGGTNWRPWSTWWLDPQKAIGPGQGRYTQFMPRTTR